MYSKGCEGCFILSWKLSVFNIVKRKKERKIFFFLVWKKKRKKKREKKYSSHSVIVDITRTGWSSSCCWILFLFFQKKKWKLSKEKIFFLKKYKLLIHSRERAFPARFSIHSSWGSLRSSANIFLFNKSLWILIRLII